MKIKSLIKETLLLVPMILLIACAPAQDKDQTPPSTGESLSMNEQQTSTKYRILTPEEAKKRMDEEPEVLIVDVRTQEEYSEGHIPGAILIPLDTIDFEPPELLPDLDAEILVYCRSGRRSRQAADQLIELGYTNVYDFGGIIDWPYDTETES